MGVIHGVYLALELGRSSLKTDVSFTTCLYA